TSLIPVETCRPLHCGQYPASLPPWSHLSAASPLATTGAAGRAIHLTSDLALAECRSLVVEFLAASQANLELGSTPFEVDPEWDQRQPALGDFTREPADLAPPQQQLTIAFGIVIGVRAMAVRADMTAQQPDLIVSHGRIGILEIDLAGTERLDFGAPQHEPGLDRLEDLVLVTCAAVAGDRAIAVPLTGHRWSVLLTTLLGPKWRNWQTRMIQGHVPARVWGFESPLRHH